MSAQHHHPFRHSLGIPPFCAVVNHQGATPACHLMIVEPMLLETGSSFARVSCRSRILGISSNSIAVTNLQGYLRGSIHGAVSRSALQDSRTAPSGHFSLRPAPAAMAFAEARAALDQSLASLPWSDPNALMISIELQLTGKLKATNEWCIELSLQMANLLLSVCARHVCFHLAQVQPRIGCSLLRSSVC